MYGVELIHILDEVSQHEFLAKQVLFEMDFMDSGTRLHNSSE